jgi:hypothetical protein
MAAIKSQETNNGEMQMAENSKSEFPCENCPMRKRAEANPKSLLAKIWRWHTGWCPGWKAYQKSLAEQGD